MILDYKKETNPEVVINESVMEHLPLILGSLYHQPYILPTYEGTLLLEYNYPFRGYEGYGYLTFELKETSINLYFNGDRDQILAQQVYEGIEHAPLKELAKLDWFFINNVLRKYNLV